MTTGMSAPPIGMMISTPSTKAIAVIDDERRPLRVRRRDDEGDAAAEHHERDHQVDHVLALEDDRRAREQPELLPRPASLPNAMIEPGERHRADERADEQLDAVAGRNRDRGC